MTKRDFQAAEYALEHSTSGVVPGLNVHPDAAALGELTEKILAWAADRQILAHATSTAQFLKTVEELGELASATIRSDAAEIADAIGDVAVTIIIATKLAGIDMVYSTTDSAIVCSAPEAVLRLTWDCMSLAAAARTGHPAQRLLLRLMTATLQFCAEVNGLRLVDCLQLAYDTIKDRKGYLTPDGVFVKVSA